MLQQQSTLFVPERLSMALRQTINSIDQIAEEATLLNLEQENQENAALKNYSLLTLMDTLLFYKSCSPIFIKLFVGIIQLMETILDPQLSFPDIKSGSSHIVSVIETIQRLFSNFMLIDQQRERSAQQLRLQINSKKLELQRSSLTIQNDKLSKWQLYESNTFILKHFDTKNADPHKLKTELLFLEESENKTALLILKCEENFKFLSIQFIGSHKQLLNNINDVYRAIHKLESEVSEERLYEFIQDSKIDIWKSNAAEYLSLTKSAKGMYHSFLGTIERLEYRLQETSTELWAETLKQQQGQKQLINEIRSVILYTQSKFPKECRLILDMMDANPFYKKQKIVVS